MLLKEKMASEGKRFLASLMGIKLSEDPPQLNSLVPQRISNEIMSGQLPRFHPSTIMLEQGESCHFMDRAALVLKRKEKSYQSHRNGSGYKVSKRWTIYSTNGRTTPVVQEWYEYKEGVVFVTNKRIIFIEPDSGFEKKLRNLTALIPYSDAIGLQFGGQVITLLLPQATLMASVLRMLN